MSSKKQFFLFSRSLFTLLEFILLNRCVLLATNRGLQRSTHSLRLQAVSSITINLLYGPPPLSSINLVEEKNAFFYFSSCRHGRQPRHWRTPDAHCGRLCSNGLRQSIRGKAATTAASAHQPRACKARDQVSIYQYYSTATTSNCNCNCTASNRDTIGDS